MTLPLRDMVTRWHFTTVFDTGSDLPNTKTVARRINGGEVPGPMIFTASTPFEGLCPSLSRWSSQSRWRRTIAAASVAGIYSEAGVAILLAQMFSRVMIPVPNSRESWTYVYRHSGGADHRPPLNTAQQSTGRLVPGLEAADPGIQRGALYDSKRDSCI